MRDSLEAGRDGVLDRVSDGVVSLNSDLEYTYVNSRAEQLFGETEESLRGTDIRDVFPAVTDTTVERQVTAALETGEKQTFEGYNDELGRWFEVRVYPDDDGLSIFFTDVSERRNRERTLEELIQRVDELLNAQSKTDIGQFATEIASEVLEAPLAGFHLHLKNENCLRGVAGSESTEDQFGDVPTYYREDEDVAAELVWEAFDRGTSLYIADTEKYGDLSTETPVKSALIHPLGNHGVFIVSETEATAFDATVRNLIALVAQTATSGLNRVERERDLRESRQHVQRQKERLGQFASVVSHDLRNPLNAAQLRLDLLRRHGADEHIEGVAESLDRMETMIADILTLSRAGTVVDETQSVSLASVAAESWETARTGDAELEVVVEDSTTVAADPGRLRRVFENLFRNAVDHNDTPLTVNVGLVDAFAGTADGGHPSGFFIEDDGDGILEDDHEEIFSHGYTTSDEGTGFGLSIVRDVVDAHDWSITVTESDEGGARFEITGVEICDRATDP
jgi:PAS domain S-box-containing protein